MYINRGKFVKDPEWGIGWECGCRAKTGVFKKCDMHTLADIIEDEQEKELGSPKCPECNMDTRRQKCAFEFGDCPRHSVDEEWEKALKNRINKDIRWIYGQL